MSERFILTDDGITDTLYRNTYSKIGQGESILDTFSFANVIDIIDLLNKLHNENEELKYALVPCQIDLKHCKEENKDLKDKVENLVNKDSEWEKKARDENYKLRKENERLEKQIESLTKYDEKQSLDMITMNAIRTLINHTSDPENIGAYSVDVSNEYPKTVKIGLTYYEDKHPFVRCKK